MYRFVYECVFIPRNGIIGFIGLFVFLLWSFESSVYILDSNLLLNMWYFLPVFLFFSECLLQVIFFYFDEIQLSYSLLWIILFNLWSNNSCLMPGHKDYLVFSSKSFTVLCFIFQIKNQFWVNFCKGVA